MSRPRATLVLADGATFEGYAAGFLPDDEAEAAGSS